MTKVEILAQAEVIAARLTDLKAIWFHYMAVNRLGFQRCYELSSLALQAKREGRIRSSVAQFYNGCVMKEIREQKQKKSYSVNYV